MKSANVRIELSDEINDDIIAGLELYGRSNGQLAQQETARALDRWLYWFRENPLGGGFFATAKCDEQVVGFRSLIPVEMRIGDRVVLGGKGEFFVVAPQFRPVLDEQSQLPIPFALVKQLWEWAGRQGMKVSFGAPTQEALTYFLLSGAKCLEFESERFVLSFDRDYEKHYKHPITGGCRKVLSELGAPVRRLSTRLRLARCGRVGQFECIDRFDELTQNGASTANCLFCPSGEMLNFRFPTADYLKYVIASDGQTTDELVFSKPRWYTQSRLAYWSSLSSQFSVFAGVLADVIEKCEDAKAACLTIDLPYGVRQPGYALDKLGFCCQRVTQKVYIHCLDKDLHDRCHPAAWHINNAHVGFYQRS